ncbi:addiction module protein [candidate division KSB1 bacterium]|nr:addiction module protein [candidate division KSB1 bacterium]
MKSETTLKTFEDALNLALDDRAELIEKLISSLDDIEDSANYEAEWAEEAEARRAAYLRGEMETFSVEDVMEEYYNRAKKK